MRVAILTQFPEEPSAPRGGVEAVSVTLTAALAAESGLDLHVVTTDPACPAPSRSSWRGVTIHRLPRLGKRILSDALGPGRRQMQAYLAHLAPEVVHAHDRYGLLVGGLPVPRVFTIHGFIYADTLLAGERFAWLRSRLWRRAETACWAEQPHIISISPYVRERLNGVATGVIHDIDNPIDESFFGIERREQKGTIFSAAFVGPRKNTLGLVEAVGRLAAAGVDVHLRLGGSVADAAYARRVEQRVAALGLGARVAMLGRLTRDQVSRELAAASVFALVSLEENAPVGVEEAMAAGVPVVTSNRCGMPYMVRDGESGFLVSPQDADDVAWRLRQLLEDDALRAAMSAKSRAIALDRFHPAAVARRTREVYRRALRDRRPGGAAA